MPIFYGDNKINLPGVSKVMYGNNEYYKPDTPGPTPVSDVPLCFTAEQANSTVKLNKSGSPAWTGSYSTDGQTWKSYTPGSSSAITLANVGDKVYFRGNITYNFSTSRYLNFAVSGKVAASGNVNSMYVSTGFENLTTLTYTYCYFSLFQTCYQLTTAPELPATTLSEYCYSNMFSNCQKLTTAPELPATNLASHCYSSMFYSCIKLTTAPRLPATTLATSCYNGMFSNCQKLTTAPRLPATTLVTSCYAGMFKGTALVTAPELPATTLAQGCYSSMFENCTSLVTAPELPVTTLFANCYRAMFQGCTALTTAPELPATTLVDYCYCYIFKGCTSLNYIKLSYTGNFDSLYFPTWVTNVAASGDFYYNGADTTRGENAIPAGWTIHTF